MHFKAVIEEKFSVELEKRGPIGYSPDFTGTTILRKN
jgi:hypothetical protein